MVRIQVNKMINSQGAPTGITTQRILASVLVCAAMTIWWNSITMGHFNIPSDYTTMLDIPSLTVNEHNTESDPLAQSILSTPIGALGPKNTDRENLIYYDSVYFLSMQFGAKAKSALEVGCASDPFSKHLSWIDTKDCVAPYFATYDSAKGSGTIDEHAASSSVTQITADFMEWENQKMYDLVVCSQVLEHVPDPSSFTKKLISTSSRATIISVPYMWGACTLCGHLTHHINQTTVLEWAKPHKPTYHAIVEEKLGKRLVVVFLKDV